MYQKPIAIIIIKEKPLDAFLLYSGTSQGCPSIPASAWHYIGGPSKIRKHRYRIGKNNNKLKELNGKETAMSLWIDYVCLDRTSSNPQMINFIWE